MPTEHSPTAPCAADPMRLQILGEMLENPVRAAVIVIDMQRDFCSPTGAFARAGVDITANQRIVDPINGFASQMRASGLLIVWVRQCISSRHISPAIERRLRRAPERMELCRPGTTGAALAEGLQVHADDPVIDKYRYSAFSGSSLDQLLRSSGIQTVILCGTAANGCVDTTARDAAQMDYDVLIASDLTGYSDARLASVALENLDRHFALVCRSDEILHQLQQAPAT